MKPTKYFIVILVLNFVLQGCIQDPVKPAPDVKNMNLENIEVPASFNYSTSKKISITLHAPPELQNAVFAVFSYKSGSDSAHLSNATFNDSGYFNDEFTIPAYIDTIVVLSRYLGLTDKVYLPIFGNTAEFDYRPFYDTEKSAVENLEACVLKSACADEFSYMGDYDSNGTPLYLEERDKIETNFLDDINESLPEHKELPESHPEYLAEGSETNIELVKKADVWVTFVAEGAGWKNALGYYTYKKDNPPQSIDDIEDLKIIFPNASMRGSGGGLLSGDKVYLGRFPANTVVSWFLVGNGWNGQEVKNSGNGFHFSQPVLNAEKDPKLKQHMVMLWDKAREKLLLGFEDIPRNWSMCDNDFNDAVFYATVNPVDAVRTDEINPIDAANDSDGDGINDEIDDFPFDPDKSFNNFYPSEKNNGTLAFEDLWPSKGDYDFNDLVLDYQFNLITNAGNKVTTIEANFDIKHIGGSYRNGFGFVLPVVSSKIKKVENQVLNSGYLDLASNGTEAGLQESVIIVVENASAYEGKSVNIIIDLSAPVSKNELGSPPFNPFIIINGEREKELHLPDMAPTQKGRDYLGQLDDFSDASIGRYFKTERNLPWALNIYGNFVPPEEKVSIDKVYPRFIKWANSGGTLEQDWYKE